MSIPSLFKPVPYGDTVLIDGHSSNCLPLNRVRRTEDDILVGFDRKVPVGAAFLEELRENDIRQVEFIDWSEDILILQGTRDEVVPYEAVSAFADEQLMEFIPIQNADHRFRAPGTMETAIKAILEFFAL
jgi:predicted acylesterase/phospholipase RssA